MSATCLAAARSRWFAAAALLIGFTTLSPAARATTDAFTLTAAQKTVTPTTVIGFVSGSLGALSPAKTSDGFPIIGLSDEHVCPGYGHPCSHSAYMSISGFQYDPGQSWLTSVTANGLTQTAATWSYTYSGGVATWHFIKNFNFVAPNKYAVSVVHNILSGHINPKYVIVGVTYAPPGPSGGTFVSYLNSSLVGNTASLSNSFESGVTTSISVAKGFSIFGFKGTVTTTATQSASVTTTNSSSVTTSFQVQNGEKTAGTGNYFAPVNHDYDQIWIWLNPLVLLSIGPHTVVWNGYGYDANDQAGLDIVPIQLGYLNGDFGAMPPDIQASLNRTWAAGYKWPAGEGPALTSADLATIAAADPFSADQYGTNYIGYTPPTPETPDHRFTLSACSTESSFNYLQAAPSTSANVYTCTLSYTNMSISAQQIINSASQTFAEDLSLSGSFYGSLAFDLKSSQTLTWTTNSQNSITNTTTSTASLSVQGPPCNNAVPGAGPCIPVYDAAGNQPTQFEVYQDNMFGTFMLAPVHYY